MADTPLPEFTVTGRPWDPFTADLLPFFATDNSVDQYREWTPEELGALPVPLDLPLPPPTNVVPAVKPVGPMPPPANTPLLPEVIVSGSSPLLPILTGITAILFPQPTGPRAYDEAPSPIPDDQLDEVIVTSTRLPYPLAPIEPVFTPFPNFNPWLEPINVPLPDTGPGQAPSPFDPLGVPDVVAQPGDLPDVFGSPVAVPTPTAAPYPFAPPLFDPFADPFGAPSPEPSPLPEPFPVPNGPRIPDPLDPFVVAPPSPGTPFDSPPINVGDPLNFSPPDIKMPTLDPTQDPFLTEFPQPNAEPDPEEDPCNCKKAKKKKKDKPKPRDVCWKGTYVQRSRGISYTRKEQVPCDAPLPKRVSNRETDTFGRPVPKKRGKRKTPTWQDTINDVFHLRP